MSFTRKTTDLADFSVPLASSTVHKEAHLAIEMKCILNTAEGRVLLSESIPLGLAVLTGNFCRENELENRGFIVYGCA